MLLWIITLAGLSSLYIVTMKALYEAGKAAARKQWAEKENQS